ncbi:MAG: VOC family protein [Acidimicrobiales bacterium]|jgi:uncharacterized protein
MPLRTFSAGGSSIGNALEETAAGTVAGRIGGPMATDWARPVVHFEIGGRDPDRLREFYAAMFNWSIGDGPIMTIAAGVGGPEPGPGGHLRQTDRPGVSLYVQVRDLRDSLQKVVELGGATVTQPFDIPNGPTLAVITDPEHNQLVLVQQ